VNRAVSATEFFLQAPGALPQAAMGCVKRTVYVLLVSCL
jgi:hypothetical protein